MNFLEQYIKLIEIKEKEGKTYDFAKLERFKEIIDETIEAYARIADDLKRQHWKWNNETEELCSLRDSISKIIEKDKEKNKEMNHGKSVTN